jgi:hypothetical protein
VALFCYHPFMNFVKKYFIWIFSSLSVLAIISGFIFYKAIVGDDSTNIFSVIFGWQWIYLSIISIALLVFALIKKSKPLRTAALIIIVSLVTVVIPARIIEASRIYITGDGGPSGPHFACLVWDNSSVNLRSGAYEDNFGLCTLMSIPTFNKFIIDRSRNADQLDSSPTYYLMLVANETIIVGAVYLASKKLTGKTRA